MARPMSRRRRRSKSMFDRTHMLPSSERAAPLMSEAVTTRRAKRPVRRQDGSRSDGCWRWARRPWFTWESWSRSSPTAARREPVETADGPARARRGRRWRWRPIATFRSRSTDIEVTELPPADAPPPLARPWDAPPGERDNPIARTRAPAVGDSRDREAPAPTAALPAGRRSTTPFGSNARRCGRGSPTAPPRRSRRGCGSRAAVPRPRPSAASRRSASAIRSGPSRRAARRSRWRTPPPLRRWGASQRARRSPRRPPPCPRRRRSSRASTRTRTPLTRSARWTPRRGGAPSTPSSRDGRPTIAPNGRPRPSFTPGSPIFRARRRRNRSRSPRGAGRPRAPARCRARRQAPRPRSSAPEIRGSSVARSTSGRSIDATIGTSRRSGSGSVESGSFPDRWPSACSRGRRSWRSWST